MGSGDLSQCTIISRYVSLLEIKDTVSNTDNIRNNRPETVASTHRPSVPPENPLFPGTISPFAGLFYELSISNADTPFPSDVEFV